jgi:hypothetical protein
MTLYTEHECDQDFLRGIDDLCTHILSVYISKLFELIDASFFVIIEK